jgi:hypothetical protein
VNALAHQLAAFIGNRSASDVDFGAGQIAAKAEPLNHAKAVAHPAGITPEAAIGGLDQGLELLSVGLPSSVGHHTNDQHNDGQQQKQGPEGEPKTQHHQDKQGTTSGATAADLLSHWYSLAGRASPVSPQQSGAAIKLAVRLKSMRDSHHHWRLPAHCIQLQQSVEYNNLRP